METVFQDTEGSILRSLLFDIFLADPFFIISNIDIASYPDIYTPYIAADNTDGRSVHVLLSSESLKKQYHDTCHLLISGNEDITVKIGKYEIQNSECEKLLGVKLDWKVNFDNLKTKVHVLDTN